MDPTMGDSLECLLWDCLESEALQRYSFSIRFERGRD